MATIDLNELKKKGIYLLKQYENQIQNDQKIKNDFRFNLILNNNLTDNKEINYYDFLIWKQGDDKMEEFFNKRYNQNTQYFFFFKLTDNSYFKIVNDNIEKNTVNLKISLEIHINKVLIHFNIFKYLSIDINLRNLGYFKENDNLFSHENKEGDSIYSNIKFSKQLIINQLKNDKGEIEKKVHFIYANNSKQIFKNKNIFFNIILFLTKSDGSLLNKFYFGLEFYNNYEYKQINDYNKIHKVDTNLNTYYVLDNGYYPFFLINESDNIIPILDIKNNKDYKYDFYKTINKLDTYVSSIDKRKNVYYEILVESHSDKSIKFKNSNLFSINENTDFKKDNFVYDNIDNNIDFFIDLICNSYFYYLNFSKIDYDINNNILKHLDQLMNYLSKKDDDDKLKIYQSVFDKLLE